MLQNVVLGKIMQDQLSFMSTLGENQVATLRFWLMDVQKSSQEMLLFQITLEITLYQQISVAFW